ncbi:hypothetical protein [Comamonas thiooxydans]|uniref:hypothetical protein n=1 Tax=Comamonas thiooxydans TaxID=363952 RepID=UPI0005A122C8|nr:hypothetical protein [Comamonas thiooxydans]MDO1474673.1 hypothetical protein [Comamonas thiooxydans]
MSTATDMVAKYLEAEAALLLGKTVSFGGRTLTVENLDSIRKGRQEWERRAAAEQRRSGVGGLSYSVARFDGPDR